MGTDVDAGERTNA